MRLAGVVVFFAGLLVAFTAFGLASTDRPQLAWLAACAGSVIAIAGLAVLGLAGRSKGAEGAGDV